MDTATEQQHSPLPWRRHGQGVVDTHGNPVCIARPTGVDSALIKQRIANMVLVARACNCHDDLVAVCRGFVRGIEATGGKKPEIATLVKLWGDLVPHYNAARAILAKAEKA